MKKMIAVVMFLGLLGGISFAQDKSPYQQGKVTWWTTPVDEFEQVRHEVGLASDNKMAIQIEFDGKSYNFSFDDPNCRSMHPAFHCSSDTRNPETCDPVLDKLHEGVGAFGIPEGKVVTIDFRIGRVRKDGIAEILVPCNWTDKKGRPKHGEARYYAGS